MRLQYHSAFSIVISAILYMIFKSWGLAIACFLSGIFIDLDHVIDYIFQHGLNFKGKNFFQACYDDQLPKVRLLLHGWEWLALWGTAAWLTDWNPWITGTLIGFSQHIVLDNLNNRASLWSYSLIWRWKIGFKVETVFPKNFSKKKAIQ